MAYAASSAASGVGPFQGLAGRSVAHRAYQLVEGCALPFHRKIRVSHPALLALPFAHELTILNVKRNTKGYRESPPPSVDALPCTAQRWRVDGLLKYYYRDTA